MKIEEAAAIYHAGEQMKEYLKTREGKLLIQELAARAALTEATVRHSLYAAALDIPVNPERAMAHLMEMAEGRN